MKTEEPDFTDPRILRRQAERILQQKKDKARRDEKNDADAKKLLHELQVHQIELEMQNEELLKAYETAESAVKKYTIVFEQAPMGFVTLENDDTIAELNFTAAEMLGERRIKLIGSNIMLYLTDETKPIFADFIRRAYTTHQKESCKIILDNGQGDIRQVYIEGIVIENDNNCMLSMVDISSFNQ
jgi:nitrogen fixation/metabolism regulation signal transduction histidine kinase